MMMHGTINIKSVKFFHIKQPSDSTTLSAVTSTFTVITYPYGELSVAVASGSDRNRVCCRVTVPFDPRVAVTTG